MRLLFLDTETGGLNPQNDQIIEIAGSVVELDDKTLNIKTLTTFENLIALRKKLDPKITRLTGISEQDLTFADSLTVAQEKWLNWLLEYENEIVAIVGHSLDFDLGFLKAEGWYLPENLKFIDTLELSRILFPYFKGINLENLVAELGIKFETDSHAHRSLYDSIACSFVFEKILKTLSKKGYPDFVTKAILANFLPLPLVFYPKELLIQNSTVNTSVTFPLEIDISGHTLPPTLDYYADLVGKNLNLENAEKLLEITENSKIISLILQSVVIRVEALLNPDTSYKFHLQFGLLDFWLLDSIIKTFEIEKTTIDSQKNVQINRIESVIWQMGRIASKHLNFGKVAHLSEILAEQMSDENPTEKKLKTVLQKVTSSHQFSVYSLQPFMQFGYVYEFDRSTSTTQETTIISRLEEIFGQLNDLEDLLKENNLISKFSSVLAREILSELADFPLKLGQKLTVTLKQNLIQFSIPISNFSLNSHFQDLFKKYPNLEIKSYLPEEILSEFCEFLNLADFHIQSHSKTTDFEYMENIYLDDFLREKANLSQNENKNVIIIGGQNSTLNILKNRLTENFQPSEYQILGETGSITKILTKINNGFTGILAFKLTNLDSVLNSLNPDKIAEIWLVNSPFFFIDPAFSTQTNIPDKYLREIRLKQFYLASQRYYFLQKYNCKIGFIKAFN